ncbi:fucolectin-like [Pomacea canaliculata]|uniref:fucolectin-like n=1 Tax=Pomacea canaliculata TaxID=400727 RepID=UPI000D73D28B|nr:fucolectin-like [Pomacea canaliculata]
MFEAAVLQEMQDKSFKNFALNAPCDQSTKFWAPNKAVDGNRNGYFFNYSCSHTILFKNFQQRHWWQVDLRKLIFVSHIIIANRLDCCGDRLANFTVELGRLESNGSITYTLCRYHDGVAGPLTTLNCTRSIWGRFVRISLMGDALTLCEVEVYGDMDDNSTRLVPGNMASLCLGPPVV